MVQSKTSLIGVSAFLLASVLAQPAFAANIYRYIDNNGQTVFNTFIPPEYVKNGYTILDERGLVIQEVPRAPTAEELAAQKANQAAADQALAARVASEEADKLLIRLFRAPEEIQRKRDNSLVQLKTQADLIKLNMGKVDPEISRLEGVVENNVKAGKEPPGDTIKKLDAARKEKAGYEGQLAKLADDRNKLIADAARDAKRLRELMGLPAEELPPPPAEEAAVEPSAEKEPSAAEKPAAQ